MDQNNSKLETMSVKLTIWIHDGKDVEIIFVDESLDLRRRRVIGEKVVGKILHDHRGDPFSGVDGSMEDNSWLDALARASPKVNACDGVAVQGVSSSHSLRV